MNAPDTTVPAKRPASHKWALLVFAAVAAANIMLNVMGHFDALGVIVTVAGVVAFLASILFARSRSTYTLGIVTLGLVFIRAIQSLWFDIAAYLDNLSHASQGVTLPAIAMAGSFVVLLFLLLRAYTLGTPSRQYFGLPAVPTRNA